MKLFVFTMYNLNNFQKQFLKINYCDLFNTPALLYNLVEVLAAFLCISRCNKIFPFY